MRPCRRTEYRYDARDRLVETIDPEGNVTQTRYDFDNNLTSVIDPNGNRTNFIYDARSRLIREVDPLDNVTVYEYDAADNFTAKIDRNSRRTELEYDDLSRLVTETWVEGNQTFSYSYDKAGNILEVTDNSSSLAFTYDARDRLVTSDNTGTPGAPEVLLEYAYDGAGNVVSVTPSISGQVAGTNSYVYDARDRLTRLQQSGSGITDKRVDFTYNNLGQFESIERYAEGSQVGTTAYSYDSQNRLTSLEHLNPTGDAISFEELEYDVASRITQIVDVDGVTSYNYDARDQLTLAQHSDSNNPDESYAYDANGNRTNSSLHGDEYQTGANNRLESDGTYNYDYDNEGNLIRRSEIASGASRELEWDYRNRLVSVVELDSSGATTQQSEYTYDAYGRRISKTVDEVATYFVYDRDDVLLDFVDSDGIAGPQQPILDKRYLHGPVTDQVLAQEDGSGNTAWHLADRLGTTRDLADNNGDVVNHFTYDSFGNLVSQTNNAVDTRYLFTGREFDPETGLHYYRARYYDGWLGRFISQDPIGFSAGDTNLYRYVNNQPVLSRDPSGLIDEELFAQLLARLEVCQRMFGTGKNAFKPDPVPPNSSCDARESGRYRDPYHAPSLRQSPQPWLQNFDRRVDLFNQYNDNEIGHRNQLKQKCTEIRRAIARMTQERNAERKQQQNNQFELRFPEFEFPNIIPVFRWFFRGYQH